MTAVVPEKRQHEMLKADFLIDINRTAIYALTRGASFFFVSHLLFLMSYVDEWLERHPEDEEEAAEALFRGVPKSLKPRILRLLRRIPRRARLRLLLIPLITPLFVIVPWEFLLSAWNSAWDILRKGVRGIPPLITAVVVVFVTSDGWQILGTGFTLRFFTLVIVFLMASLIFLIHKDFWSDIDAGEGEATALLEGIERASMWAVIARISRKAHINAISGVADRKSERPFEFRQFLEKGVQPLPIVRPAGLGAFAIRAGYVILFAFSLIVTAIFVAISLIIVGLILVNHDQTKTLAHAVYVYQTFPGNVVVTRQLFSLSLSLGAMAAFILVATQRPEEREAFMKNILIRYRRVLLVYSIYCRAHDRAEEWTGVPVKVRLCQPEPVEEPRPVPQSSTTTAVT